MGKGEETRQTVLEQAAGTASRLGLAGLTIGTLASTTGMSKSGLFGHFRSKEALQLQVLAHAREIFIQRVIHPALTAPRGQIRLRTLFDRWVASVDDPNGCLFVSASTEFDDQPGPVREQLRRDHRDLLESIAQIFRTGISEGQFRADGDPDQFACELFGIMLSYFHAHRLMDDPAAADRARRAFERLLDDAR